MSSAFDFSKLKADLFSDTSGQVSIEQVQVNQRHLIDKILARYSAEFTVYREMIQNANDAGASEIEIAFKRKRINSGGSNDKIIESIVVRNNGRPFSEEDWRRLKSIAEGNPDEQKIGFFGVGFYSLFSICEEPLVISGGRCLGFYWRGDQLFTRSGPVEGYNNDTRICLQLREPLECPDGDHFAQFLGKAILFTVNLKRASFSIDDTLQLQVEKTAEPDTVSDGELKSLASSILKSPSTGGLFTLKSLQSESLLIKIDKRFQSPEPSITSESSSFLSGLWRLAQSHLTEKGRQESAIEAQLRQPGQFSVKLKYLRGMAAVSASSRFSTEMERTTKKKPFKQVYIDLIWSGEEAMASDVNSYDDSNEKLYSLSRKHPVLKHLLPTEKGKVYIGFETHQSTGVGVHLAAPFIPTVERESIDFVDGCLRQWNIELLQIAGKMTRLIWEQELRQACKAVNNIQSLRSLLKTFNFTDSTPAPHVCVALFREFLDQRGEISLPAKDSRLVPLSQLRFIPSEMQSFMKNCPQVPQELESACTLFLQRLQSSKRGGLPTASHLDIIQIELKQRQLSTEEVISLIKWWSKNAPASAELNREFSTSLKITTTKQNVALPLAQISLCPVSELIALHTSEPDWLQFWQIDCLPVEIAEAVSDLLRGLKPLTVAGWLEGLARNSAAKEAIQLDQDRAERLLLFCSRHWDRIDEIDQGRVASVLASMACIPTASGALKLPRQCFFDDVAQDGLLSADCVLACSSDLRRSRLNSRMLKAAGVQSHLPLESIMREGIAASLSTVQYLFTHRDELSRSELERIRTAAIFPSSKDEALVRLCDLFVASPVSKQLGLPHLKWADGVPREGSELGQFMERLGFNYTIPWRIVLDGIRKCQSSNERAALFQYFFEHYAEYETFHPDEVDFPFLPVETSDPQDKNLLLLPSQVFLNEEVEVLGFYLLAKELRRWARQLGVSERPSSALLAKQVAKSRLKQEVAGKVFAFLSMISFTGAELEIMARSAFIPTLRGEFKRPDQLFFKSTTSNKEASSFTELFDQVDFGPAGNAFLRAIGVSDEPTTEHLVQLLCAENGAERIFSSVGHVRYCKMMEKLAVGWNAFARKHSGLARSFASAPVFIASIRSETQGTKQDLEEEEEHEESLQFRLYKSNEAFLIDDTIAQQIFNLPAVPGLLNDFYAQLGCKWISSAVKTEWKRSGKPDPTGALAKEVQKMLNDRLGLIASSLEGVNRRGRKKVSNAKVFLVDWIKISRVCSVLKRENLQSVCAYTDGQDIYVAYSQGQEFDAFDLATVLVELLCEHKKGRVQDALLVATLLTTPLSSLRAKGFQINEPNIEDGQVGESKPHTPTATTAPIPNNRPISPVIPEQGIGNGIEGKFQTLLQENSNNLKRQFHDQQAQSSSPNISTDQPQPCHERPESPNAIKSFFGLVKQSTESLLSKIGDTGNRQTQRDTAGKPRNDESLQEVLRRGIKSLRKHHQSTLEAPMNEADQAPPEPSPISRQKASGFCCEDARLVFYRTIGQDAIRFYFPVDMDEDAKTTLYNQFNAALISFYRLIVEDLGRGIFSLPSLQVLNLFYDPESPAIAFNYNHSLFFNLAYFLSNRHHVQPADDLKIRSFWFIIFCHELAHNFVGAHNAEHEFYMASFLETYMPEFCSKAV